MILCRHEVFRVERTMIESDTSQLTLQGVAPEKPTDRLFLALFPDAAARDAIVRVAQRLKSEHALHGPILKAERLHVTLHHLGDHAGLRRDQVEAACRALKAIDMPSFDLRFDHAASFASGRRRHPLVLRGAESGQGVHGLWWGLAQALQAEGLGQYLQRQFEPHVTLLYDAQRVAPQHVDPVGWTVHELALVHSLLGRTEYRILGRRSLCQGGLRDACE